MGFLRALSEIPVSNPNELEMPGKNSATGGNESRNHAKPGVNIQPAPEDQAVDEPAKGTNDRPPRAMELDFGVGAPVTPSILQVKRTVGTY